MHAKEVAYKWFATWKKYFQKNSENPPVGITTAGLCGKRVECATSVEWRVTSGRDAASVCSTFKV
jgi:hypothetical protein